LEQSKATKRSIGNAESTDVGYVICKRCKKIWPDEDDGASCCDCGYLFCDMVPYFKEQTMDSVTYQDKALRTMASQSGILERLNSYGTQAMQLINGTVGLSNEVGELNDAVKRHIEYGKPLDVTNVKEEVGDCFWRLRQICQAVGLTFEECMEHNIAKLKVRYPEAYSDTQADEQNRDRNSERKSLTGE
jgi:NTP pyrophosphatase (non-canonical NTP hydrolase)